MTTRIHRHRVIKYKGDRRVLYKFGKIEICMFRIKLFDVCVPIHFIIIIVNIIKNTVFDNNRLLIPIWYIYIIY